MKNLLAQGDPIGTLTPPAQVANIAGQTGEQGLSTFVTLLINLIIGVSAAIFVIMIVLGGAQWIASGGNKDKIAAARQRITHAVIGLFIVMTGAAISQAIGTIFGYNIFGV